MSDQLRKPEEIKIFSKVLLFEIITYLSFLILLDQRHENVQMEISQNEFRLVEM